MVQDSLNMFLNMLLGGDKVLETDEGNDDDKHDAILSNKNTEHLCSK